MPVKTPTPTATPTRATWKAHGQPQHFVFYGRNPAGPQAKGVLVSRVVPDGLTLNLVNGTRQIENVRSASPFWASPVPNGRDAAIDKQSAELAASLAKPDKNVPALVSPKVDLSPAARAKAPLPMLEEEDHEETPAERKARKAAKKARKAAKLAAQADQDEPEDEPQDDQPEPQPEPAKPAKAAKSKPAKAAKPTTVAEMVAHLAASKPTAARAEFATWLAQSTDLADAVLSVPQMVNVVMGMYPQFQSQRTR